MKFWASIAAFFAALLTPIAAWLKGQSDQRRKRKIKGLKAKVKALEEKDKVDEMSDEDVATALSEWVRPPDK